MSNDSKAVASDNSTPSAELEREIAEKGDEVLIQARGIVTEVCGDGMCTVRVPSSEYLVYHPKKVKFSTGCKAKVAAEDAPDWLPIRTAPRDGTAILLAMEGCPKSAGCGSWHKWDDSWFGYDAGEPTHWQPLPEVPE